MIEKYILIFALTFSAPVVFAQDVAAEKAAEIKDEMAQELSSSEEEKAKIYTIHHIRFQTAMEIRIQYAGDIDAKKATLRKVYDKLHGKLLGAICSDRMKAWGNYKRNYKKA
jgi:DNA-directed RNA polymerase subunit L